MKYSFIQKLRLADRRLIVADRLFNVPTNGLVTEDIDMKHWRIFAPALAFACLAASFTAAAASEGAGQPAELAPGIAVAGQLREADLPLLKAKGYTTIINLRPDGEGPDQPPSAVMATKAHTLGLRFLSIPVRPGGIPGEAVDKLQAELQDAQASVPGRVLIYCRSGSRAARTWALAEASRPGGRDADAIMATVRMAGQSADDLSEALRQRVERRGTAGPAVR